jgi:hypothetical protein
LSLVYPLFLFRDMGNTWTTEAIFLHTGCGRVVYGARIRINDSVKNV